MSTEAALVSAIKMFAYKRILGSSGKDKLQKMNSKPKELVSTAALAIPLMFPPFRFPPVATATLLTSVDCLLIPHWSSICILGVLETVLGFMALFATVAAS
jgi:hypothetical protein